MRRTDRERDADFALAVADKCEWATVSVHALRLLCQKYTPQNMAKFDSAVSASLARTGVFGVKILSVTGKAKVLKAQYKGD